MHDGEAADGVVTISMTSMDTAMTATGMGVVSVFGYRRRLRRGIASGNVHRLTNCKLSVALKGNMLVQLTMAKISGAMAAPMRRISVRLPNSVSNLPTERHIGRTAKFERIPGLGTFAGCNHLRDDQLRA